MATTVYSLDPSDAPALRSLYETYGWWAGRDAVDVRRALTETDEVVALRDDGGELVAAARVLTDYTYYAMVFDVVVHADRRGEGHGSELMAAAVEPPELSGVTPTLLAREGVVEFYESCGSERTEPVAHPDGDPEPLRLLAARDE